MSQSYSTSCTHTRTTATMDEQLIGKSPNDLNESIVTVEGLQGDADQHVEPDPKPLEEGRELLKLILPVVVIAICSLRQFKG